MSERPLTLDDFDYPLPEALVAQEPRQARDQARLLVRAPAGPGGGGLRDLHITDLTAELPAGTLLILNDTRVFPSRLRGRLASGGQVELFLLQARGDGSWEALARPLKKLEAGTQVQLAAGMTAEVTRKREDGAGSAFVEVRFHPQGGRQGGDFAAWLDEHGYIPLPPYIKRPDAQPAAASADRERYQTVYAKERGSVAAPTAGLHFTPELLAKLAAAGVEIRYVSLHVGAGTFLPVKTNDPEQHRMHAERYRVGTDTAAALLAAKAAGRPVVAVGTTTLRSLEDLRRTTSGDDDFRRAAGEWRSTELYLRPRFAGDRCRVWPIDALITNFHQPRSTLFMLVAALIGLAATQALYAEAIRREYRLFSYGDACLLWL